MGNSGPAKVGLMQIYLFKTAMHYSLKQKKFIYFWRKKLVSDFRSNTFLNDLTVLSFTVNKTDLKTMQQLVLKVFTALICLIYLLATQCSCELSDVSVNC